MKTQGLPVFLQRAAIFPAGLQARSSRVQWEYLREEAGKDGFSYYPGGEWQQLSSSTKIGTLSLFRYFLSYILTSTCLCLLTCTASNQYGQRDGSWIGELAWEIYFYCK